MTEKAPPYSTPPRVAPVSIRPGEDLATALAARGGTPGLAAKRALERYVQVLADELARLDFSFAEAALVCDALNGTYLDEHSYRYLWAEVADAISLQGLDRKWEVENGDALVARLRDLSPGAKMARLDAVERFWQRPNEDTHDVLRDVGLVRV
jgi:hypothetical protein